MLYSFFWVILRRLNFMCHVSEHCSMFKGRLVHATYEDGRDSVPKRRHIKFRRRAVTQKKQYNVYIRIKCAYYLYYCTRYFSVSFQSHCIATLLFIVMLPFGIFLHISPPTVDSRISTPFFMFC